MLRACDSPAKASIRFFSVFVPFNSFIVIVVIVLVNLSLTLLNCKDSNKNTLAQIDSTQFIKIGIILPKIIVDCEIIITFVFYN